MGLLITLGLGLFIILGGLFVLGTKNNTKFITFSLSFAFSVMIVLIVTDLFPEALELFQEENKLLPSLGWMALFTVVGFLILLLLDHFVPDHEDDPTTTKDDKDNLKHISLVSSIALVIHNIVEGMAVYLLTASSFNAGMMASIGIGLHNIPLGMVIASTYFASVRDKKKTFFYLFMVSLSTFLGGLIVFLFHPVSIPPLLEGMTLSVTMGMLFYIILLELLPKLLHTKEKKATLLGLVAGFVLLILSIMI